MTNPTSGQRRRLQPLLALFIHLGLCASPAWSNPDADFPKSPEVQSDRRVTFRLIAPEARNVEVAGSMADVAQPLKRGSDEVWEVTLGPIEPGVHDYYFLVDGTWVLDPHNRWLKGWRRSVNQFVVPGNPPRNWQVQNVPHGVLHRHVYHSKRLQTEREIFVYTPPGYARSSQEYPVLFLLHGSGDDASAWTNVGRAHVIADNLLADNKMEPMVIVMPYGHGHFPGVDMDAIEDKLQWWQQNNRAVRDSFFAEVLPFAATEYRIREDADGRAVAGLSMGGGQALQFGLASPAQFGWVLGYSSGTPESKDVLRERFGAMSNQPQHRLVWMACGNDDRLLDRNELFHEWLTAHKVPHTYLRTSGGHTWDVWRKYLEQTLPMLFVD